jgi:transcriptional regulator with XRE-family HTH domain
MSSGADLGLAVMVHRVFAGMTQGQLAAEAGVSDKTISTWKTTDGSPNRKRLRKVAGALRVSLAELEDLAADIAKARLRRLRGIGAEAASSHPVEEARPLRSLSLDELHRELGRTHEYLDVITAELRARREPPEPSPAL